MNSEIVVGLFIVMFLSACSKDSEDDVHKLGNCLILSNLMLPTSLDCRGYSPDTNYVCEVLSFSTPGLLSQVSKSFLPLFCCEVGDKLRYQDENGNSTNLILTNKEHDFFGQVFSRDSVCGLDSVKSKHFCVKYESAVLNFLIEFIDEELEIELFQETRVTDNDELQSGGELHISTADKIGNTSWMSSHILVRTDNGDLLNPIISEQELHEQLIIRGVTYDSVYSYHRGIQIGTVPIKNMLYNKDYGIISFSDSTGNQWVLQ